MSLGGARTLVALGAAAVLVLAGCDEDDGSTNVGGPGSAEVQAAIDRAVEAGAPGIAVRIKSPDRDELLTAGVASLDPSRAISEGEHSRIASVTKSFTAAITMQLVEEGDLSLDDSVEALTPGLLAAGRRITIRDLLAHTSGVPDYVKSEAFGEQVSSGASLTPEGVLELVATEPLEFAPGTEYGYSDSDNIALGLIIEELTGRSYEDELDARIIDPLGLEQTTLATEPGVIPDPHFVGYQFDPEAPAEPPEDVTDVPIDPNGAWASGALISTPDDVATFFEGLLAGRLVGLEQVEQMMETTPGGGSPPGPGRNRAGLGIFGWEVSCGEVWGHTGSFPGFRTLGAASADGKSAIAVFVNATEVPAELDEAILDAEELAICRALGEEAG